MACNASETEKLLAIFNKTLCAVRSRQRKASMLKSLVSTISILYFFVMQPVSLVEESLKQHLTQYAKES